MRTLHPVLMVGVNDWNESWLSRDEFMERLRIMRSAMSEYGWRGIIVHGDCDRSSLVTYLTNFCPVSRWGIALIGPEGEPELLVAGSTRDLPPAREQTWLRDVYIYSNADNIIRDWIARVGGVDRPRIGAYGFHSMRPNVHDNIVQIVGDSADLDHCDQQLDSLVFCHKRPREIEMIKQATSIVSRAASVLKQSFDAGADLSTSLISMEREARLGGVHDARIMASYDGGKTLQPFFQMKPGRVDPLVVYLAVRYCGYWSETTITVSQKKTDAQLIAADTLNNIAKSLRPGMTGKAIAVAMAKGASGTTIHPLVRSTIGHSVGISLDEERIQYDDGKPVIFKNGVYSLRFGLDDPDRGRAIHSVLVQMREDRADILLASSEII